MATNLPRRRFLHHLTSSAACLAFLSPTTALAIANKSNHKVEDLLSFTDLQGLGPKIDAELMGRSHIALHEERLLPEQSIGGSHLQYVKWLLREMLAKEGVSWDEDDKLVWTYQHYGYCDHSVQCYKLLDYAESAHNYLYDTVDGLLDIKLKWQVLNAELGSTEQTRSQFSGIIGRYTYLVHRVFLVDAEGETKDFGLINITPVNRAINFITSAHDIPSTCLMYVIPGNTSLVSPFSELLHLTTHGPSRRLAQQLEEKQDSEQAEEASHIIGETITESAAILIAQKYLKKHRHENRMRLVNAHARSLGSRYSLIADTVAYMGHYGIEETLQTFADDPLYLVNAINKSRETMRSLRVS